MTGIKFILSYYSDSDVETDVCVVRWSCDSSVWRNENKTSLGLSFLPQSYCIRPDHNVWFQKFRTMSHLAMSHDPVGQPSRMSAECFLLFFYFHFYIFWNLNLWKKKHFIFLYHSVVTRHLKGGWATDQRRENNFLGSLIYYIWYWCCNCYFVLPTRKNIQRRLMINNLISSGNMLHLLTIMHTVQAISMSIKV